MQETLQCDICANDASMTVLIFNHVLLICLDILFILLNFTWYNYRDVLTRKLHTVDL